MNAPTSGGSDYLAELPEQVIYLLYQVHRRREIAIEETLKAIGLSLPNWRVMLSIQRMQPCTMNALARYTTIDRTGLTRALDQLVKQGLVSRSTPPHDRRQVLVSLTPAGVEAYEAGYQAIAEWNKKALGGLSHDRLTTLLEGLTDVIRGVIPDRDMAEDIIGFNYRPRLED